MPIVLYGLTFSAPCVAVLATAKVIGVEIDFEKIDLMKGENLTESYRNINPAHSIPAMDDDGLRIWESRAIVTYLIGQYGKDDKLYPKDLKQRAKVDNMLYFDASNLYASFANFIYPQAFEGKPSDPGAETKLKDRLSILDSILAKHAFAVGDNLTVADISLRTSFIAPTAFGLTFEKYPNIVKWMAAVEGKLPVIKSLLTEAVQNMQTMLQGKPADKA